MSFLHFSSPNMSGVFGMDIKEIERATEPIVTNVTSWRKEAFLRSVCDRPILSLSIASVYSS